MKCDADSDFDVGGWLMVLIMIDGCEEAARRINNLCIARSRAKR